MTPAEVTTPGGALLMLAVLLPAAGILCPSRSVAAMPSGLRSSPRRLRS